MSNNFNGQINISRDLRKNKQVVIGKYDLTDIIFLLLGFGVAIIVSYVLGFSPLKVVDEFTAILISIFPMLLIISLGFKRTAGIRQFNFIRMKQIDKKSRVRFNRRFDNTQKGDKFIAGFLVDRKYVNKYINKFLSYDNLSLLQVRWIKDIETNKNSIYFLLDLRYENYDDVFIDLMDKFSFNKELIGLSHEELNNLQKDIDMRFENKKQTIDTNILRNLNILKLFNKNANNTKETIKNENNISDRYKDKKYKIHMLNIYDIKVYNKFINTVKRYCDVICYFKRAGKKKFVNTFLLIEDEIKKGKKLTKLERIDNLCMNFGIIVDKLSNDQVAGRNAVSYLMTNTFNNYRVYR